LDNTVAYCEKEQKQLLMLTVDYTNGSQSFSAEPDCP